AVQENGRRALKLLDFGVAKVAAERGGGFLSTGGKLKAITIDYAAPEQISRAFGPTGPWTDVYALAMVVVELMLGRHPFHCGDPMAAMSRTCDKERRPTPRGLGLEVSDAVETVFARALAVQRADRFPDAGAFWTGVKRAAAKKRAWLPKRRGR